MRAALLALALALVAGPGVARAETYVWIDGHGVTHITDDPDAVPPEARHGRDALRDLWHDVRGPGLSASPGAPVSREEARTQRLLAGAVDDLRRGESARAAAALEAILREQPGRPEPHWYLALLDRERGRYESAEAHLDAFLAAAGDDLQAWRASAERRRRALADELRLADEAAASEPGSWVEAASRHFRIYYDPDLGRASQDYAHTVMRYLEEARAHVSRSLGAVPLERTGVVFYGRAAYQRAHASRFSFQTVGFFDGRIHVVSAAHPAGELRALLFHEYTHAVFRDQTGGDRPYWLNEGLAELSERSSRRQPGLTRSERSYLCGRIDAGDWIPLARLSTFSGLDDDDARAAYLEATAATQWIEDHSDRAARARLLAGLGAGRDVDRVLTEVLGLDTAHLDERVRGWLRSEFPDLVPPGPPGGSASPAAGTPSP